MERIRIAIISTKDKAACSDLPQSFGIDNHIEINCIIAPNGKLKHTLLMLDEKSEGAPIDGVGLILPSEISLRSISSAMRAVHSVLPKAFLVIYFGGEHFEKMDKLQENPNVDYYENGSRTGFIDRIVLRILQRRIAKTRDRLAFMQLLTKTLRHDINGNLSPLLAFFSNSEYKEGMFDETLYREIYPLARWALSRLESLVENARNLENARMNDEVLSSIDLTAYIRKAFSEQPVHWRLNGEARVLADTGIRIILDNLIQNAVRHGRAKKIDISLIEDGAFVSMIFTDNGSGISEDKRSKIFEEGFSGLATGTGLGLFIVRSFMERYGGSIRLISSEEGRTSFCLMFKRG
jgi:signal transduction histidine kinase